MASKIGEHELIVGDATSIPLEENSVDAIVCDPPYGLAFVPSIHDWDKFKSEEYEEWCQEWASELIKVLKPGGHILSFSGTRTFHRLYTGLEKGGFEIRETLAWIHGEGWPKNDNSLKPSFEPIALARKPIDEKSIKKQIEETGTGFLNTESTATEAGRHPANVILDKHSEKILDNQSGVIKSSKTSSQGGWNTPEVYNDRERPDEDGVSYERGYDDSGGASRFFYTAKASKSEKTHGGQVENTHKTVKPINLMEWLVKLVTKEGQIVLDPFMGSGTTAIACENERRKCIGMDRDEKWVELSKKRILAERNLLNTNPISEW